MHSPEALLVLDSKDQIIGLNHRASVMGFEKGKLITSYMTEADCQRNVRDSTSANAAICLFNVPRGEKHFRLTIVADGDATCVWLQDKSEQLALADKNRRLRSPDAHQIRASSQLTRTSLGYAELLAVIFEEGAELTTEKLAVVKQYHAELMDNLRDTGRILEGEATAMDQGTVLVVDQNPDLAALIVELLRTEGYRVVGFSDVEAAAEYFAINRAGIGRAVIEEGITDPAGAPFIDFLRLQLPDLPLVILTRRAEPEEANHVRKPLDFQALLRTVARAGDV